VARLRLSSIEPWDVTPALIDLWDDPRLCRHLHLPLQSGCEATLRRMGRRYSLDRYLVLADELRARIPGLALTTDVIVGFPGETDDEFAATLATVERIGFSRLHVFRYSPRPGTPAARLPGAVDPRAAQARSETLIALGRRQALAFHQSMVGGEVEVLLESADERPEGLIWSGLTDNYVRVECTLPDGRRNTLVRLRAVAADEDGLRGQPLD
jgi:threonylcarbamoyladenosine tRNA methylthiotransferase MtaB